MDEFKDYLNNIADGKILSEVEAEAAFNNIMSGDISPISIAGFLMALRTRGEALSEIIGAVSAMRAHMVTVSAPNDAIDIVGTGGDTKGSFNISTACAFVVGGQNICVAKHGNKAVSSKSGAADVLSALNIPLDAGIDKIEHALKTANIAFLFAPLYHPAMKAVVPVRQELKVRTIFNILGPLCNPAGVKRLLIGTYDKKWLKPMAETLGKLGAEHVWVVHGHDGMDEISTTGPTYICEYKDGAEGVNNFTIHPQDVGIKTVNINDLKGGNAAENASAIHELFDGKKSAFRDIVLLNSAAAFIVAGRANNLSEGMRLAEDSIDNGKAKIALQNLINALS